MHSLFLLCRTLPLSILAFVCGAHGLIQEAVAEGAGSLNRLVISDFTSRAYARGVAIQSDGKIVAVGTSSSPSAIGNTERFALARYNIDGSLDAGFGSGGRVITALRPLVRFFRGDSALNLTIQGDGKILVAGSSEATDFALTRYHIDGSLDRSFGDGGQVFTPKVTGSSTVIQSVGIILQEDGKILAVTSSGAGECVLMRYHGDGSPDSTFERRGSRTGVIQDFQAITLQLQKDGKILMGGHATYQNGGSAYLKDLALVRLNADGSPDHGFGGGGKVVSGLGDGYECTALQIQTDGRILMIGAPRNGAGGFALLRFHTDGVLDGSFGVKGSAIIDIHTGSLSCRPGSLTVQQDGKIVVAGSVYGDFAGLPSGGFVVARCHADGALDQGFGNGGSMVIDNGPDFCNVNAVTMQSDGGIVMAGQGTGGTDEGFAVLRCRAEGIPDSTFGHLGKVITSFGVQTLINPCAALQRDGKIVLAASALTGESPDLLLVRYTPVFSLDKTFGLSGRVTAAAGVSIAEGGGVAVQNDGKTVMAGTSHADGGNFVTVRRLADGSADRGFGDQGRAAAGFGGGARCHSMVLQRDGRVLAAGTAWNGAVRDFALARWNGDGSPDKTFGREGRVMTPVWWGAEGGSVAVQRSGRIILAGTLGTGFHKTLALLCYHADGSPDRTFGTGGMVISLSGSMSGRVSMALQRDGKIVVAGSSLLNGENTDITLLRFNENGSMDTGFGTEGVITTAVEGGDDRASSLVVQEDGKILVTGTAWNGKSMKAALLCYQADGRLDTSFGSNGRTVTGMSGQQDNGFNSAVVQSGGGLIIAGITSFTPGSSRLALLSYTGTFSRSPQEAWRQSWFQTPENAGDAADDNDYDNDGMVNLLEWACGLDPTAFDTAPLTLVPQWGGQGMVFTYSRSRASVEAGTSVKVEFSNDMDPGGWRELADAVITLLSDDGTVQRVQLTLLSEPVKRLFVRLKVMQPSSPP